VARLEADPNPSGDARAREVLHWSTLQTVLDWTHHPAFARWFAGGPPPTWPTPASIATWQGPRAEKTLLILGRRTRPTRGRFTYTRELHARSAGRQCRLLELGHRQRSSGGPLHAVVPEAAIAMPGPAPAFGAAPFGGILVASSPPKPA